VIFEFLLRLDGILDDALHKNNMKECNSVTGPQQGRGNRVKAIDPLEIFRNMCNC